MWLHSAVSLALAKFLLFSAQFQLILATDKTEFGYELLLTKLELLDYEIAKHVASTKLQINAILNSVKELTSATATLSALQSDIITKQANAPKSCKDESIRSSGIYLLQPEKGFKEPFLAYCDQQYEGGGWTIIQNRFDGSVDFVRPWEEYRHGFGHLDGEFWLGLDKIHQLTYGTPHELHIILEDFDGKQAVARYSEFSVASENELFKLSKLGTYNGTAGDSLGHHRNHRFSTLDRDNDQNGNANCATVYSGAWWHVNCHLSNLNGLYLKGKTESYANGMCWQTFRDYHYSLKVSKMMIRSTK